MTRIIKSIGPYLLLLGVIVLILYFTRGRWDEFKNIRRITPGTILFVSVTFVCSMALHGYMLKLFTGIFDVHLTFMECIGLNCVQAFGNYLPFRAGLGYNAFYLKYQKGLPITKFVSLFTASIVIVLMTFGGLGILLLLMHYFLKGKFYWVLLVFFAFFVLVSWGAIVLPLPSCIKKGRVGRWLESIEDGWRTIKTKKSLLLKFVIMQIVILGLIALQFLLVFRDLGVRMDFWAVSILACAANLIRYLSVLPGNLGIRELVVAGIGRIFGFSFEISLLAATASRIVAMFWTFLLGITFSFHFINKNVSQENRPVL